MTTNPIVRPAPATAGAAAAPAPAGAPVAAGTPAATTGYTPRPRPAFRKPGGFRPGSRPGGRPGTGGPGGRPGGRRYQRTRVCQLCVDKAKTVDYKEPAKLGRYISDRGRIEPRRRSGACARHQRLVCEAIKRARHLALLPYTASHVHVSGGVGIIERPPRPRFDRRPRFNPEVAPAAATPIINTPAAPAVAVPAPAPAPAAPASQGKA